MSSAAQPVLEEGENTYSDAPSRRSVNEEKQSDEQSQQDSYDDSRQSSDAQPSGSRDQQTPQRVETGNFANTPAGAPSSVDRYGGRVYIGNVPADMTEVDMRGVFADAPAAIEKVYMKTGYAFVHFAQSPGLTEFLQSFLAEWHGQRLKVEFSKLGGIKCHTCGREGHKSAACRSGPRGQGPRFDRDLDRDRDMPMRDRGREPGFVPRDRFDGPPGPYRGPERDAPFRAGDRDVPFRRRSRSRSPPMRGPPINGRFERDAPPFDNYGRAGAPPVPSDPYYRAPEPRRADDYGRGGMPPLPPYGSMPDRERERSRERDRFPADRPLDRDRPVGGDRVYGAPLDRDFPPERDLPRDRYPADYPPVAPVARDYPPSNPRDYPPPRDAYAAAPPVGARRPRSPSPPPGGYRPRRRSLSPPPSAGAPIVPRRDDRIGFDDRARNDRDYDRGRDAYPTSSYVAPPSTYPSAPYNGDSRDAGRDMASSRDAAAAYAAWYQQYHEYATKTGAYSGYNSGSGTGGNSGSTYSGDYGSSSYPHATGGSNAPPASRGGAGGGRDNYQSYY